ncbi:hypothetical protein ACQP1O_01035 [Nocardia sp. CA-151230]|uniref:hypothetical protein n=1 Tax=Nocardia sp. CA-151230 TaxID=3239982 RepID=UPI003D93D031
MDRNGRIARIGGPALAGVLLDRAHISVIAPTSALFIADTTTFVVSVVARFARGHTDGDHAMGFGQVAVGFSPGHNEMTDQNG